VNGSDSAEYVYKGRTPDGRTGVWPLRLGHEVAVHGSALLTHHALLPDGSSVFRRTLPATAHGIRSYAACRLDNEIRSLVRLAVAFPGADPAPFPRLLGYDVDAETPSALVSAYRGKPAATVAGNLLGRQRTDFVGSLFWALAHLDDAGIVHGAVGLPSLYLDGAAVQFITFEDAVLRGEGVPGRRRADPRDDVLDAGLVLYEVFAGAPARRDAVDLAEVPVLERLIADVFAPSPGARPAPAAVARRLGRTDLPLSDKDTAGGLAPGYARFDEVRAGKTGGAPSTPQRPAPARPKTSGESGLRKVFIALVVMMALSAVTVTLVMMGVAKL
jgi:hypothetical protein